MTQIINNLWLCSWREANELFPTNPLVITPTKDLPFLTENTIRIPLDDLPKDSQVLNKHIKYVKK
jgi:hypothetical protein